MKVLWHRRKQVPSSRREKRCTQPCRMQPVFIAWWKSGGTVNNSSFNQKVRDFRGQENGGNEAPNRVVRHS